MKEKLEIWLKKQTDERNKMVRKVKAWVQDESIPLEERWEIFIKSKLGDEDIYIVRFNTLQNIKSKTNPNNYRNSLGDYLYDDTSRYTIVNVNELYEELLDYHLNADVYYDSPEFDVTEQTLIDFKREVLQKFIYSFRFDW